MRSVKDIFTDLIYTITQRYNLQDNAIEDKIIFDGNLSDALLDMKPLIANQNIVNLIDGLYAIISTNQGLLSTDIDTSGTYTPLDFTHPDYDKKNRPFTYSDNDFAFVSSKYFINNNTFIDISQNENSLFLKVLIDLLEYSQSNPGHGIQDSLLTCIENGTTTMGFLINRNNIQGYDPIRLYNYIYLKFLNEGNSINIDDSLSFQPSVLNANLSLQQKQYEQFLDIYDVINEMNLTKDILSRFLKLYHILEYLAYRVYLVDLVQRVGNNKIFVREFAKASALMKINEGDAFVDNFTEIFSANFNIIQQTLTPANNPVFNQAVLDFLIQNKFCKSFQINQLDITRIAKIVYQLRCSIVHNKESEFHLTITNPEDYSIIIPFIRELTNVLASIIIDNVSNNNPAITYTQPQLKVY